MFRKIGENYYNDIMFQKIIDGEDGYFVEFGGGSRLKITKAEYDAIIENGWCDIGTVHYNKELISKLIIGLNGKRYAEFTNGETMPLTGSEWDAIISDEGGGGGTGGGVVDIEIGGEMQSITASDSGDTIIVPVISKEGIIAACEAEDKGEDARFVLRNMLGEATNDAWFDVQTSIYETDQVKVYNAAFWAGANYLMYQYNSTTDALQVSGYTVLYTKTPAVLTIPQSLSSEEKAQVLDNLGIVDAQNIAY